MKFNQIEEAIEALQQGKLIVIIDDEKRENEGDLVGIAETITAEKVNFMIKKGGGLICMPLENSRLQELELPQMVSNNQDPKKTQFTISVDAVDSETGISAFERAHTIKLLANPQVGPERFSRPGHIFPIATNPGGVFARAGHTESSIALAKLAGFYPATVICEILKEDGNMARGKDLYDFCQNHGLVFITVESIIDFCKKTL